MSSKPLEGIFGPRGNAASLSNRGKESRGTIPAKPPVASGQAVKKPLTTPVPVIVKSPSQGGSAGPGVKLPKAPLAPVAGREVRVTAPVARPVAPGQAVKRLPAAPDPAMVKGPSQVHSIREGQKPGKAPSVAFGGYRGANESKVQSLRGQASRQTVARERPAAVSVKKGGSPAKANAAAGKQR